MYVTHEGKSSKEPLCLITPVVARRHLFLFAGRVGACLLSHHFSPAPPREVLAASHTNLSTCGNSAKSVWVQLGQEEESADIHHPRQFIFLGITESPSDRTMRQEMIKFLWGHCGFSYLLLFDTLPEFGKFTIGPFMYLKTVLALRPVRESGHLASGRLAQQPTVPLYSVALRPRIKTSLGLPATSEAVRANKSWLGQTAGASCRV